jgi:tetratricopeptide (TPR) repeat protein
MPATRLSVASRLLCELALPGGVLISLLIGSPGCRSFRSHKVSDESIAAARQLSLQGIDAQQHGRWDRAETLFAAAILKCPSDERARFGYAESLWQRGATQQAVEHMEEAVRLSGNDPERLVRLGQMYRDRGDLVRAGRQADAAIAVNGQLAAAWALRGHVLLAQGDSGGALTSFHRALNYEQPLPDVQLAIARIYAQENRPQRVLATLQSLAATYPAGQVPQEVLVQEGLALRALGRHQDAVTALAAAAQVGNPSAELLCELARTQMLAGDTTAARQTLTSALQRAPQHPLFVALASELNSSRSAVIVTSAVGQ